MIRSEVLRERLAEELARTLRTAQLGHCIRVDNLDYEDAKDVCSKVRQRLTDPAAQCWVLVTDRARADAVGILPERAVELRNDGSKKLCLLVPTGTVHATLGSLNNAFASFDVVRFLRCQRRALLKQIRDAELRAVCTAVEKETRRYRYASEDDVVSYLADMAASGSLQQAGRELWRVGLVPDLQPDGLAARIATNRKALTRLLRAGRAGLTLAERIADCGLSGTKLGERLEDFLEGQPLHAPQQWLRKIADERQDLSFEKWPLHEGGEVEWLEVEPFVGADGKVTKCGLAQPDGQHGALVASLKQAAIQVRWRVSPSMPAGLARWSLELEVLQDDPDDDLEGGYDIELPKAYAFAKARKKTFKIKDLPQSLRGKQARIVVTALNPQGVELKRRDGEPARAYSQEFWLEETATPPPARERTSVRVNLPLARIEAMLDANVAYPQEEALTWNGTVPTKLSWRYPRVGKYELLVPPVLAAAELTALQRPEECLAFRLVADADGEPAEADMLEPIVAETLSSSPEASSFRSARREAFRVFCGSDTGQPRPVAGTLLEGEPASAIRRYAREYRKLLAATADPAVRAELLRLDTVEITLCRDGRRRQVLALLPTHPLKLLWLAAYHELLGQWAKRLAEIKKAYRRSSLVDRRLLRQLKPIYVPFAQRGASGELYLFAAPLDFHYALYAPLSEPDPLGLCETVAATLGADTGQLIEDELPGQLAHQIEHYLATRRGCTALRINVLNPGAGSLLRAMLQEFVRARVKQQQQWHAPLPRIELLLHTQGRSRKLVAAMQELQETLYKEYDSPGGCTHLAPFFSFAVRPLAWVRNLPGGAVHLCYAFHRARPALVEAERLDGEDSTSLYGMVLKLLPTLQSAEDRVVWQHKLVFPAEPGCANHPAQSQLTGELLACHRAHLACLMGKPVPEQNEDFAVGVRVELGPEELAELHKVHSDSDWVITVDRMWSVELFDSPRDVHTAPFFERYLLDYAPDHESGLVGTRLIVTTSHREEVERILSWACRELGFEPTDSVPVLLRALRLLSGRLALRALEGRTAARETVALAAALAYLERRGELRDSILVPLAYHEEVLGRQRGTRGGYCDFVRIRLSQRGVTATFYEVKSRTDEPAMQIVERIAQELDRSEQAVRDLFFSGSSDRNEDGDGQERIDHWLQRAWLVGVLRHYAAQAYRHGLIATENQYHALLTGLTRLERGITTLVAQKRGFVVALSALPTRPIHRGDVTVQYLTARDFDEAGLSVVPTGTTVVLATRDAEPSPGGPPKPVGPPQPAGCEEHPDAEETPTAPGTAPEERTTKPVEPSETSVATPRKPATHQPAQQASSPTRTDLEDATDRAQPQRLQSGTRSPAGASSSPPRIVLGRVVGSDEEVCWRPSVVGSPHVLILGISGQGKSTTVARMIRELTRSGVACFVFDYHGDFCGATNRLTEDLELEILRPDPLPFSPLELVGPADDRAWRSECMAVREILAYVCKLGEIQAFVLQEALEEAYKEQLEGGRLRRIPTLSRAWELVRERAEQEGQKKLIYRCKQIFEYGLFSDEARRAGEFARLLQRTTVLDLSDLKQEELQNAASAFVLRRVYRECLLWGAANRIRLALVLDEAHRLARDKTLPKIMKELRKFGVAVIVSSQNLQDFHQAVLENAGTKIVFRLNHPESKRVAPYVRLPGEKKTERLIEQLTTGRAIVWPQDSQHAHLIDMYP